MARTEHGACTEVGAVLELPVDEGAVVAVDTCLAVAVELDVMKAEPELVVADRPVMLQRSMFH